MNIEKLRGKKLLLKYHYVLKIKIKIGANMLKIKIYCTEKKEWLFY